MMLVLAQRTWVMKMEKREGLRVLQKIITYHILSNGFPVGERKKL